VFISITKSSKTDKNIFTVDFIPNFFIFSTNYSSNREIKIDLAHLHACILQCLPNDKNVYIGIIICHILSISTVIFGLSTVNFSPFQGPNRFVALLPQSDKLFQNDIYHCTKKWKKYTFFICLFIYKTTLTIQQLQYSNTLITIQYLR